MSAYHPIKKKASTHLHKGSLRERFALDSIGLEAEFVLLVDGRPVDPAKVFGSPGGFVRQPLMHRTGTSYHIPTGGAMYFDTGVIEVVTPVIEIDGGCAARAGRSLWEGIHFLREELDAWERRSGRDARLRGFSAHYNISFNAPPEARRGSRSVEKLARLLSYIIPPPVMLLAANRESTGIGVRPRGDRVEVTADFTPSAALTIATATLITGITREVMTWPSFELDMLEKEDIPVIQGYAPIPHTSRQGWLARYTCYPRNPFHAPVDDPCWSVRGGDVLSMREIAGRTERRFRSSIRKVSDPFTLRLIDAIVKDGAPVLLDLPERPAEYDDVGRLCSWSDLFPEKALSRSRYERILIRAIRGVPLPIKGRSYKPVGMRGWSRVVFRRDDGSLHVFSVDGLRPHLRSWERATPPDQR